VSEREQDGVRGERGGERDKGREGGGGRRRGREKEQKEGRRERENEREGRGGGGGEGGNQRKRARAKRTSAPPSWMSTCAVFVWSFESATLNADRPLQSSAST